MSSNSTFNNKSTLTFPTNKQLTSTEPAINWNFLLSNVGSTIVYCALQTVDTSAVVGLGFPLIGGVTSRCIFLQQDAKNKTEQRFTYSGSATDYGVQNIVGYVTNMPVWGAHALNNTTLTGKTSGSPFTTTAHSVVLGEAGPATTLQIGSNGTFTFNGGTIAEIIIYNKTLTNVEMNNIGTYFVKKYGACV